MIDQGVNHTLAAIGVTDLEETMNHFERVAVSISDSASEEDLPDLNKFLGEYLQKKADKLGVKRSFIK
jgi:hypothetical protein